jgi:hypothetical protein
MRTGAAPSVLTSVRPRAAGSPATRLCRGPMRRAKRCKAAQSCPQSPHPTGPWQCAARRGGASAPAHRCTLTQKCESPSCARSAAADAARVRRKFRPARFPRWRPARRRGPRRMQSARDGTAARACGSCRGRKLDVPARGDKAVLVRELGQRGRPRASRRARARGRGVNKCSQTCGHSDGAARASAHAHLCPCMSAIS